MSKKPKPVRNASVAELHAALQADPPAQLVDVRTPGEFRGGHVPGAQLLAETDVESLDPKRPLWLICRSGARSARAAGQFAAQGFEAVNVQGGTMAWRAAGHGVQGPGGGKPVPGLMLPLVASLTLGLAPFQPEPHIVGKLRWIAGGANGMGPADWFDVLMHGAPWLWLLWVLVARLRAKAGG